MSLNELENTLFDVHIRELLAVVGSDVQLNDNGRLDSLNDVEEKVDVAIKNLSVYRIRVGLPRPWHFESLIRALTMKRQGHRLRSDVGQGFAGLHV